MRPSGPRWTGKVELISSMLDVPLKRRKPTTWFVNSMSDLFHENLSDEDVYRCFAVMELAHWHTFQILTKRAERLPKLMARIYGGANMGRILPNVWLGTSIGVRSTLHRVDDLRETPAAVRFLSLEPLLEELGTLDLHGIDWVIVGGESGPGARPCDVDWIRAIVAQCKAARVACFVKQLGALVIGSYGDVVRLKDPKGGDPAEWPEDLRVREVPRG
jgi:protein gp37